MALTRVSPALFATSNNITSVTVGGSANTISLTFDSNGVITGASNNAVSVANTAITGNIVSSQIAPSVTLTTPLISGNLNFDATGTSGIRLTSANTLTFHTVGTEDFRIDANGNMGIGGSVDNHGGYGRCLQISASAGAALELEDGSSYSYLAQNGTTLQIRNNDASGNIVSSTNATERTRIDFNGNFSVGGQTDTIYSKTTIKNNAALMTCWNNGGTSGYFDQIYFFNNAGTTSAGSIQRVNDSTISYLTSSDYRLKENITPMTGALAKVAQLKPVTYKWKTDNTDGEGFIAHELQEVCPIAVSGVKDAVDEHGNIKSQSVDTSFLVATLTAAIQELKAINDTQAATITTLSSTITALTARMVAVESK